VPRIRRVLGKMRFATMKIGRFVGCAGKGHGGPDPILYVDLSDVTQENKT